MSRETQTRKMTKKKKSKLLITKKATNVSLEELEEYTKTHDAHKVFDKQNSMQYVKRKTIPQSF